MANIIKTGIYTALGLGAAAIGITGGITLSEVMNPNTRIVGVASEPSLGQSQVDALDYFRAVNAWDNAARNQDISRRLEERSRCDDEGLVGGSTSTLTINGISTTTHYDNYCIDGRIVEVPK